MTVLKLTKKNVEAISPPDDKPAFYWDEDLKGFGLRVMPSGVGAWIAEYRPGAGGRSVQKKRVKIGALDKLTPERARESAKVILANATLGADPAKARAEERAALPFAQLARAYVETHVRAHRKPTTAANYLYVISKHIDPYLGTKRANTISDTDIEHMHRAIGKASGKYIANRAMAVSSAVFNWAKIANPVKGVRKFKEDARQRYLTADELQRLGDALREAETTGLPYEINENGAKSKHNRKPENRRVRYSPHVTGAIRLLMFTGARLREILHLRWVEYDVVRGLLFLPDSKTGKKTVVLSEAAIEVLKGLPRVGAYVIAGRAAGTDDEQPRYDIKKPWATICARAGIDGVHLHDLRHTFASVGAGSDLGLPVIGNLLGHANPRTTQRYAHVATDASKRAADLIAGQIAAAMGGK